MSPYCLMLLGVLLIALEFNSIKWLSVTAGVFCAFAAVIIQYLPNTPILCVFLGCALIFTPCLWSHFKKGLAVKEIPVETGSLVVKDSIIGEVGVVKTVYRDNFLNVQFPFSFYGKTEWNCQELQSSEGVWVRVEEGDKIEVVDVKQNLLIVKKL